MSTNGVRAAIYLRVSRDDQTNDTQRRPAKLAEHVAEYRPDLGSGISSAKGRDQRPAFDKMLKDAVRRRFDVLMVWSIDRLDAAFSTSRMLWPPEGGRRPPAARPCWHRRDPMRAGILSGLALLGAEQALA